MFDIGFWEMAMIAVLSFVILGPQQMTLSVRTIMSGVNKAKAMAAQVSGQLNKELKEIEANVQDKQKDS
ncbi:hypothetical protein [Paraferrimonas sedimenticola]|uniref:Sec-independent protein translocase protein TatB n=1 Tax=Paraferrimonas sedimenticola TaxID=375674 RepID=A0AA37RWD8_9GAMM|nr:hypothetical protein [Paraferrimonas sedimenticola]GLP96540.1 hypothetical protein GCM10007895_18460 [Paraferrimonas sedimenticola]